MQAPVLKVSSNSDSFLQKQDPENEAIILNVKRLSELRKFKARCGPESIYAENCIADLTFVMTSRREIHDRNETKRVKDPLTGKKMKKTVSRRSIELIPNFTFTLFFKETEAVNTVFKCTCGKMTGAIQVIADKSDILEQVGKIFGIYDSLLAKDNEAKMKLAEVQPVAN